MKTLRFVLGDQLNRQISSLRDLDPATDVVLMVEVVEENTYVRHHKQKIALVLSAMRHFAEELRAEQINVDYVYLDSEGNRGSFSGELQRAVERHWPDRIVVAEPGEWRVWQKMQQWSSQFGVPVEIRANDHFLTDREAFARWANGRKNLRMEFFYRNLRRKTGWLMDGDQPVGGQWNYDLQNRKPLPKGLSIPQPMRFAPDSITREVIRLVGRHFGDHFGDLSGFGWAVNRSQALLALQDFIQNRLPNFGKYQDAMSSASDVLFHSTLSPYLNLGLLTPNEVCRAALRAYESGEAALASVEGFLRQILGWREYVRGVYWTFMPDYARSNFFAAQRPLPAFYWTGETEMNCLRHAIRVTQRNAYAHHIQRLMLTGNFALLAGVAPALVEEWYLVVYADAFDWVELPNTHGMALFADGGLMASKPYLASGAYINRMSDYCHTCAFDVKQKLGEKACPFNYLYWNFLLQHQRRLCNNPRMTTAYQVLRKMPEEQKQQICHQAQHFLDALIAEGW
ncbi:MAG: cryptochrome/photolyase family protein [Anaerolineales bacterium]|nr:cryptochrome/photolyase family protein [Anaerolineales bacterium]MDW8163046.1 cryptochrome/photolyase family protein [Anaerolineales bacterium]